MGIKKLGKDVHYAITRIEESQKQLQGLKDDVVKTNDNVELAGLAANKTLGKLKKLKAEIDGIKGDVTKIKDDTHDLERYAYVAAMGQSVINMGLSIADITIATINNRPPHEIAGHALKLTGSVAIGVSLASKLLGSALPWLGPFAVLFGECLLAAGSAMTATVPEKSVSDQIKEELAEFGGDERRYQLDGVLDAIERVHADLKGREDNSLSWDDVNRIGRFTGPDEVIWLGAAESWLHDKLQAEVWPKVFTAYAHVSGQFLQNLTEGFLKIKWPQPQPDGSVNPSDDIKSATLVLEAICVQYKDMMEKLLPEAALKSPRWFIGSDGNVYRTDGKDDGRIGDRDTRATAISIGSDGDRIWTVGENHRVYTYSAQSGSWGDFEDLTADDISVVRKVGTGQDHVFMLKDGNMEYRCWDESQDGWPKFVADAPCPLKSTNFPQGVAMLAATGQGVVFYLPMVKPTELCVWDAPSRRTFPMPPDVGPNVLGMTANDDRLYVYSSEKVYWVNVLEAVDAAADILPKWNPVSLPDNSVKSLFASPDGTILAVLGDDRMHFCCDDKGDVWHETDSNTAQKAVMWPVSGWETYARLQSMVKGVNDLRDVKFADTGIKPTTDEDK